MAGFVNRNAGDEAERTETHFLTSLHLIGSRNATTDTIQGKTTIRNRRRRRWKRGRGALCCSFGEYWASVSFIIWLEKWKMIQWIITIDLRFWKGQLMDRDFARIIYSLKINVARNPFWWFYIVKYILFQHFLYYKKNNVSYKYYASSIFVWIHFQ